MSFADWLKEQGIERELDVLMVSTEQFRRSPQKGTPYVWTWSELVAWLSEPAHGEDKACAGGWSPAAYKDSIRRKSGLDRVHALVVDIDQGGDVDKVADAVAQYDAVVHETYSSTREAPRCRLVIRFDRPTDATSYERVHAVVRERLRAGLGCAPDEGAKDASRLSYAPCRPRGSTYRVRICEGYGLSVERVLASVVPPAPRSSPRPVPAKHKDKYVQAALRRGAEAVASASDGARHETVCREAYSLARLGVSLDEVMSVLLPVAVAVMGERRAREAERTIRDGYRARSGAA